MLTLKRGWLLFLPRIFSCSICRVVSPSRLYCSPSAGGSSPIHPELMRVLVCPLSKETLRFDPATNELICDKLGVAYPVISGVPSLVPEDGRLIRNSGDSERTSEDGSSRSEFATDKARVLGQVDLSRKGSVDEPIAPLVEYLNSVENYYTTSSCSGRISAFSQESTLRKKGCQWLLISHGFIDVSQLMSLGSNLPALGYVYFKFEPFVLHVMCRTLQDAQALLQVAIGSGFRNSGITCGKKGRIMVAVRSTHSLEAPIACNGDMIVSKEYLKHLVEIGNKKLSDNLQKVDRFFHQVRETLSKDPLSLPTTDTGKEQMRTKLVSSHCSGKGARTKNASSGSAGVNSESDTDNPEETLAQLFGNPSVD